MPWCKLLPSYFASDTCINHCVKSVQIRSYFWSVFSCIRTEYIYYVNLHIQSEYREIRTRNNSVFGHFSRSEQNLTVCNSSRKLQGLIIHPIILSLKYNLDFLKGIFIPWGHFSGGIFPSEVNFNGAFFPSVVSYN